MTIQGALVKEQGVNFAIVVVKPNALNSPTRENIRIQCTHFFKNVPIILMAENINGKTTYHGRPDIVKFLSNIDPNRIPWKTYTF